MRENNKLKKIQETELEILTEFDRICRKHGLTYFLDSGTALGAVRHGGFIPWDDDIDVGMPREDYEKFMSIAPTEMDPAFFLQNKVTDPKSPYYFAKIRKNNTLFMEWNKRNMDIHHGIYIDIFPYDNLPDDQTEREAFLSKCKKLYQLYVYRTIPDRDAPPQKGLKWMVMASVRRMLHYLVMPIPLSYLEKKSNELYQSHNQQETRYTSCCIYGFTFMKDHLYPVKEIQFEDKVFFGPADTDAYLTSLYGDYMTLPKEEDRMNHFPYKVEV